MIFIHFVSFLFFKTLHQMGNSNLSGLLLEIWHICYQLFCFSSYSELCFRFDLQCLLDNSNFFLRALQCAQFVGLLMIQIITFFAMYWLFCAYRVFLVCTESFLFSDMPCYFSSLTANFMGDCITYCLPICNVYIAHYTLLIVNHFAFISCM